LRRAIVRPSVRLRIIVAHEWEGVCIAVTEGFKHITVSPEPEEDVVIYAGLGARQAQDESAVEAKVAPDDVKIASDEVKAAPVAAEPPVEKSAPERTTQADARPSKTDDPDRMTPDELDAGPMPLKQRIVIAAVIICLIGAIAYYFAFMR